MLAVAPLAMGTLYSDLQDGLDQAQPGDIIEFSGTHNGNFETTADGTASDPIIVRGVGGNAVILGSSTGSGYGLTIEHDHYIFEDFTVKRHKKGIYGLNADDITVRDVVIEEIGQEAFKVRRYSNFWFVERVHAENTGLSGNYGEGFYVGDAESNWENSSTPDTSGYVTFLDCSTTDTRNDGYDVKEGAHHVKFINCVANFSDVEPQSGANAGDSGWYIRGNHVQLINCTVEDLTNGGSGVKIFETSASGGPYGRDNELKAYTADNLTGSAIHIHKSAVGAETTLYTDYTLIDVDGGLYYTSSSAQTASPGSFTELTWSGTGGDAYAGGSSDSTPNITTTSLPDATVGSAYNESLSASGGDGTLAWSLTGGSLPAGIFLDSDGDLYGNPSVDGTSNFTVQVADSDSDTDSQALSLTVNASGGGGGGSFDLKLQYECANTNAVDNDLKPDFLLVNQDSTGIDLDRVTVRYWFTSDGNNDIFDVRYAEIGNGNVTGSFGGSGSDRYLEVSFTSGAGQLAASDDTKVKVTVRDSSWNDYTQTNDYSFDGSRTSFADYDYMTVYVDGALVWGIEP